MNEHIEHDKDLRILQGIQFLEPQNDEKSVLVKQRKRATDHEIEERQEEILNAVIDNPGITQQELSGRFNVSLSTIQRDIDDIKNKSLDWVNGLSRGDFIHHARIASLRIDNQIARLQYRITNEDLDPKTEAFLMKTINEFVRMQIDMEIHPVYQLLKKIDYRLGQIPSKLRTWQSQ